jgi:hypothetical protein
MPMASIEPGNSPMVMFRMIMLVEAALIARPKLAADPFVPSIVTLLLLLISTMAPAGFFHWVHGSVMVPKSKLPA